MAEIKSFPNNQDVYVGAEWVMKWLKVQKWNMIITIARQHGSAGREIAQELGKRLNIRCFDKEIVDEAANDSSICRELINSFDEKRVSPFIVETTQYPGMSHGLGLNIQVASAQFDVIKKLADKGDCIFVGRCADYILRRRADAGRPSA